MELETHTMSSVLASLDVTPCTTQADTANTIQNDEHAVVEAHQFAAQLKLRAAQRDLHRELPWDLVQQYSQTGLWAITVPKAFGGAGVSLHTLNQVIRIIAAADGNFGHIPQNHFYALEALRINGSPEQQNYFYAQALAGKRFGNALAEIGHKDFRRRTLLRKTAQGLVVHGKKFYCTGSLYADWIPTLVSSEEDEQQYLVFIPARTKGVSISDDWDGFGQKLTGSGTVSLDEVQVEAQWVLPFSSLFSQASSLGPFAQYLHAAIDLGIGEGALEATVEYVRQHSRPWIDAQVERAQDDPLLIQEIGKVAVRLHAAQVSLDQAAQAVQLAQEQPSADSVTKASLAVAAAKILSTQASLLSANKLFELAGTSATAGPLALDRYWRNARVHTLHDPVRWKFHAIGNYYLNDQHPPRHGAI